MLTSGAKPAVLIVDDNRDICDILSILFGGTGHSALWVQSGQQALEVLKTCHPRVVILDMMMPGLSGIEVLRRIRANPNFKDVRVLMYSAISTPEKQQEALEAGSDQYIVKGTMDYDTLKNIVKLYVEEVSNG